ncbi:MAG: DUF1080 domain-containing protein [Planctomycetota bacterium]
MKCNLHFSIALAITLFLIHISAAFADFERTDQIDVAGGSLVVAWPESSASDSEQLSRDGRYPLLLHFHGRADTVLQEAERAGFDGVVAIVNFSGLSSAYRRPFEIDASLFEQLLGQVGCELRKAKRVNADSIEGPVVVSSFSAGYGAVREILKSQVNVDRIQGYLAADSIYASIVGADDKNEHGAKKREVQPQHMKDFLKFARLAAQGEKFFLITHSAQPTPYASTTETADYLLKQLLLKRTKLPAKALSESWQPTSECRQGGFQVLGYSGTSAEAHLRHLRKIGDAFHRARELQAEVGPEKSSGPALQIFDKLNDENYTWLLNGKYDDPQRVFSVEGGELTISGVDNGYVATRKSFENYRLSLEFRWGDRNAESRRGKARDSGLFLHAHGKDGNSADGDGAFMSAIECQIMEAAVGDLMLIRSRDETELPLTFSAMKSGDDDADGWPYVATAFNWPTMNSNRASPRKITNWGRLNRRAKRRDWKDEFNQLDTGQFESKPGEWNHLTIRCAGDVIVVALNNRIVNSAFNVSPTRGKILLQSEGSEVVFRRIGLTNLPVKSR